MNKGIGDSKIMKVTNSHLTRLWYEPNQKKYILAYSDEENPRVASVDEVGELSALAIHHKRSPSGALAAPLVAQIAVTSNCNFSCKFCYADLTNQHNAHMSTNQVKSILDLLCHNGTIYIEWAGGEPLLRPDFVELLQYAHELDFKQSVLTNGTSLSREFMECAPIWLSRVQIGIDDLGNNYNDLKGGAYWSILEKNLCEALKKKMPIVASIILSEHNAARLENIVKYIYQIGIRTARISWQVPMGKAENTAVKAYCEFIRQMEKPIRSLQRRYSKLGFAIYAINERPIKNFSEFLPKEFLLCSASRSRLHINWNGDVYPCPVLSYPEFCAGNILDSGFKEIWFSRTWEEIRAVKNSSECKNCKLFCSYWCRALVYGFTKNITMTPSPLCPRLSAGESYPNNL